MSITKWRWRAASALIAAGAAAAAVPALAVPALGSARAAAAAASPGWRVVKQFSACGSSFGVQGVTATSAANAWATGDYAPNCNVRGMLIAHWDGRSWSNLQPPAGFRPAVCPSSAGHAVAALSASYAWVFADRESCTTPPATRSFALLWQNGGWQAFRLADNAVLSSAVVFTHSNAWAFGGRFPATGPVAAYAVHFNGQSWQSVPVPVLPQGTASPAPDNIWAVGPLASAANQPIPQPYALAHWTGRWQTIPFPNLGLPTGEGVDRAWVVADGSQGAWVAGDVGNQSSPELGGVLLHWTGSGWVNVKVPFQTGGLGPLSHDGQSGLWIASLGPTCSCDMAHYSAGQWSVTPVPIPVGYDGTVVNAMRLIPRTQSVWAGGYLFGGTNGDMFSAMLKYGP